MPNDESIIEKIFKVRLVYEPDQSSADRAKKAQEELAKKTEEAQQAALRAKKAFTEMRESAEKMRSVGIMMAGLGAAISGPLMLTLNAYMKKSQEVGEGSQEWEDTLKRIETSQARIGKIVYESVLPAMKEVAKVTKTIADFAEQHPDLVKAALTVGSVMTTAGLALATIGQLKMMVGTLGRLGVLGAPSGGAGGLEGMLLGGSAGKSLKKIVDIMTTSPFEGAMKAQKSVLEKMAEAGTAVGQPMLGKIPLTAAGGITGASLAAAINPATILGGVTLGASIYDATIGKAQGTDAGTIAKQTLSAAGATLSGLFTQIRDGQGYAEAYRKTLEDTAKMYGLIDKTAEDLKNEEEGLNKTMEEQIKDTQGLQQAYDQREKDLKDFNHTLDVIGFAGDRSSQGLLKAAAAWDTVAQAAVAAGRDATHAWAMGDALRRASSQAAGQDPAIRAFDDYRKALNVSEQKYQEQRIQLVVAGAQDMVSAVNKFRQAASVAKSAYNDQRLQILLGQDEQLATLDKNYYKQRAQALKSFNEQIQQQEQDHATAMQRMSQDHGIRLRKLAEQRDALGVEDEMKSYQLESRRAEEDFRTQLSRQSAQAAESLKIEEDAHQEQVNQIKEATAKQLTELKKNYDAQSAIRTKDFLEEMRQTQDENRKKLGDLKSQHDAENTAINDSWTQRRRDLGIWLSGEEELFNNYMLARQNDLQNWINTALIPPGLGQQPVYPAQASLPNLTGRALGGYTNFPTVALLGEQGREFTLNASTTRQAERMLGGSLTQNRVLGGMGGGLNATINMPIGPVNGGNPEELGKAVEEHVYRALINVTQAVLQ